MSNLTTFIWSQLISSFAFDMLGQAVAFHILISTGNIAKFALPFIVENLVKSFTSLFSGYIVDRFNRKALYVLLDMMQFFYLLILFYYLSYSTLNMTTILAIPFVSAIFKAISYPLNKAVVQNLKGTNSKASSFEISNDKVARTLAPAISILFFARFGLRISILITSFMFGISAVLKRFVEIDNRLEPESRAIDYIKVGFRELFKSRLLVLTWINAVISQIVFHPFLKLVIPKLIKLKATAQTVPSWLSLLVYFLGADISDIYMSLIALLSLASGLGVIFSMIFFQYFEFDGEDIRGMKYSTLLLIPMTAIFMFVIVYLSSLFNLDAVKITYILFPINILFYFLLNSYNVFFTLFYQKKVLKKNTGRFFGTLIAIYMVTKAFGYLWYKNMLLQGLFYPSAVLVLAAIFKYILFMIFEKEYIKVKKSDR